MENLIARSDNVLLRSSCAAVCALSAQQHHEGATQVSSQTLPYCKTSYVDCNKFVSILLNLHSPYKFIRYGQSSPGFEPQLGVNTFSST